MRLIVLLLPVISVLTPLVSCAQAVCPDVQFKNAPSASLSMTATTRLNLVRQSDGSYKSYETANTSPYGLLSTSPHFEKHLTSCLPPATRVQNPAPVAPANPVGSPSQMQAVALLKSGDYLVVTSNNTAGIYAAVFDPQMNLISVSSYPIGEGYCCLDGLALADVNGDGNPDIVYIINGFVAEANQQPGQVTILLGKGGSSFQPPISYSVQPTGAETTSFAIGDLNGDHKLDIAIAVTVFGGDDSSIVTFLGNGDGTFQAGPVTAITPQTGSIAMADLNGDGKLDIAVTVSDPDNPTIAVVLGNGDGTFAAPSYIQGSGGSIAIGDMNNDGIPDIVTVGTILFGDGTGSFPKRQDYYTAATGDVILTDFDGDGRMDVVVAGGTPALLTEVYGSTITVLFGQPDGTFFGPALGVAPGLAQPGSFITDLRTADFNGDGILDLVYAGEYGIGAMLGKGDGTFTSSFTSPPAAGWEIATGDFDGDGNQDIVAVFASAQGKPGVLSFFSGKGDGTFQAPLTTSLAPGPAAVLAGDFNGDGKLDLAVLFSNGVTIYFGEGDGSFQQAATYPTGGGASWILAGDLNNDGRLDLVMTTTSSVTTLLGRGDGTFVQVTRTPLRGISNAGDSGPSTMSLADFNRDGKLDLVVTLGTPQNSASGFAILLGKGDGTFQAPVINSVAASSIAAADLNGDGIPDLMAIALVNNNNSAFGVTLYYLLGNGDGSFQPQVGLNVYPGNGNVGGPLTIADVNRDGRPDLVSSAWPLGFFSLLDLTAGPPPFQMVSSASFALGPVAADSFVSAFGTHLPISITGLSIQATDSEGASRAARALYTSATQLNFIMPAGTSAGVATVSITSSDNATPLAAQVDIVPVAPGLFTLNGAGLAAAYAVVFDAQGHQSYEPAFTVQNGTFVAMPIDLGTPTDQVYLSLFGTGFDNPVTGSVKVTIGGQTAPVTYAGPQGTAGLDQVNVLLPHGLAGSGDSAVVLSAGESTANTVHITIQ